MAPGIKTGGRKPGSVNKTTATVKAALEQAFEKMGGVDNLVEWAKSEPTEFYKLYSKLLPLQVNGNMEGGIVITVATGVPRAPDE